MFHPEKEPHNQSEKMSKGIHVKGKVWLGLAAGDEKQIPSGLRYPKHIQREQIHFKSSLYWLYIK